MQIRKIILIVNGLVLALIIGYAVRRDFHIQQNTCWDIRNRVVGARLQLDGRLPYYYHWKPADGLRYFDPWNVFQLGANNITASPFLHQLLYPFCNLPQRDLSLYWFMLEYVLLAGIIALSLAMFKQWSQRIVILNAGVLFTLTQAWIILITTGQYYLVTAFLGSCVLFLLSDPSRKKALPAGLAIAAFLLIRPPAMLLLIPLIFYWRKYYLVAGSAAAFLCLYVLFVLSSSFERRLWQDYRQSISDQVRYHQGNDDRVLIPPRTIINVVSFEGISLQSNADTRQLVDHVLSSDASANVFVFYERFIHRKLPVLVQCLLLLLMISAMMGSFLVVRDRPDAMRLILFCLLLYLVSEFFSPVKRHQYYTVQWFPLVLAGFAMARDWRKPVFWLLTLGLILNMMFTPKLSITHTVGEFLWGIALLLVIFQKEKNISSP